MTATRGDPGSSGPRVVLHVDMDAFFASVEVRDDPGLAGRAVIVGGSGPRGVVAACTYEARRYGVHSAMSSVEARRRCPDALFLSGRYDRYAEESARLHAVLHAFTPLVEGVALDEAFLDVTGSVHLFGDGPAIGAAIRRRVADELGLACSVGVGRSKLMAKLASKAAKPSATRNGVVAGAGVVAVAAQDELAFLHPLPVRALWGIGPATERRLRALGVATVGELAAVPPTALERHLGSALGRQLAGLARAEDDRPVLPGREAKSVGHEETFAGDVWDRDDLHRRLHRLVDASATALRTAGRTARTVTVKLRFGDFTQVVRSQTLEVPVDATPAVAAVAAALLDTVGVDRGVRLLGVSLSGLADPGDGTQLALPFGPVVAGAAGPAPATTRLQDVWGPVAAAVDAVRARYGRTAVGPASLVADAGLDVRRRGEAQWGPQPDRAGPGSPPDRGPGG